ncbi:MAG: hypothetical protein KC733_00775 [Candidatus Omnitrophica bacterium]|nr:hypothetical protein [Candidatus Omnitrophota bacterium]
MKKFKFSLYIALSCLITATALFFKLSLFKSSIIFIFLASIFGSLFYWEYRLGFMFIGSALFLLIGAVTPEDFIRFASLEVILFLISMMIVVGMMKDAGLFEWMLRLILRIKKLTGRKLFLYLMFFSAIFSALMGEVASIMIMIVTILQISELLEIDPVPLVFSSIIATNIGSAATVLGNPVGILIATHSGLSFEDFLFHALPNSMINLMGSILLLLFVYRRYVTDIHYRLKEYTENQGFLQLITISSERKTRISIVIFCVTIFLISLHKRFELLLNLQENTLLLMFPILSAGIVLMYCHEKARSYIENEIEWPSIIFFMFLFAQAGVIKATGVAQLLAKQISDFAQVPQMLIGIILFTGGILSSVLDNVIAVAAYIPLIQELQLLSEENSNFWWALLFGACYGGNITMIGSTANIVALGLLEKNMDIKVTFIQWLKIGFIVGIINLLLTFILLTIHIQKFHF